MTNHKAIMEAIFALSGRFDGIGNYMQMYLVSGEIPDRTYIEQQLDEAEKYIAEITELIGPDEDEG